MKEIMKATGAAVGMTIYRSLLLSSLWSLVWGCDGGTTLDDEGVMEGEIDGDKACNVLINIGMDDEVTDKVVVLRDEDDDIVGMAFMDTDATKAFNFAQSDT